MTTETASRTRTTGTAEKVRERVVLNIDRCIGCRSCAAACHYGHRGLGSVAYGVIREGTLPVICRQCEEPACVEACPNGALRMEADGLVVRSDMLCSGCSSCVYACPFGVISPRLVRHQVMKCDCCPDRLDEGKVPRCVAACPSGALSFRSCDEVGDEAPLLLGGRTAGGDPYKRR